jgi:hypothetical protein
MGRGLFHPKNGKRCMLCKRWGGDAALVFKSPQTGYEYSTGIFGKCMKNGSNQASTNGNSCRDYEPSYEASRLL